MKLLLPLTLVFALFCFSSCESEDDLPQLPCELIGEEVSSFIRNNSFDRTRVEAAGLFFERSDTPFINACTVELDDIYFNLEKLIYYRLDTSSDTFIMGFE